MPSLISTDIGCRTYWNFPFSGAYSQMPLLRAQSCRIRLAIEVPRRASYVYNCQNPDFINMTLLFLAASCLLPHEKPFDFLF